MKTLDETIAWLEYVNATTYPSNFEGAVYHLKTLKDENNKLFGKVSSLEQELKDAIETIDGLFAVSDKIREDNDGLTGHVSKLEQQLKDDNFVNNNTYKMLREAIANLEQRLSNALEKSNKLEAENAQYSNERNQFRVEITKLKSDRDHWESKASSNNMYASAEIHALKYKIKDLEAELGKALIKADRETWKLEEPINNNTLEGRITRLEAWTHLTDNT